MPFFGIPIRNGLPIGLGSSAGINAWSPGYASLDLTFDGATTLDPRITFSRTSNATLTDSNGRVAYAPHNLLTNSEDFEAGWIRSNSTVTSNAVVAEDGTTTGDTVVSVSATAITGVYKIATITAGINTQSIYVKQATGVRYVQLLWTDGSLSNEWANFDLQTGTLTGGSYSQAVITPARNGWYRLAMTSATTASVSQGPWIIAVTSGSAGRGATYPGNGTDSFSVWGAQLNVANAPVNLLTFSEQFDNNAAWTKQINASVTANQIAAPDGTITADLLTCGASPASMYQIVGVIANGIYTARLRFKYASSGRWFRFIWSDGSSNQARVWFDALNGVKGIADTVGTASNISSSVNSIGDGWYEITLTGSQPSTTGYFLINSVDANGSVASASGTLYIWGAQLNTGSTALPYVATTSSIYLPPSYNSTTPKNLLGFTQEFDNAAWTKSNSFVQTNLLTWSEQFDNTSAWTVFSTTVVSNSATAPDGNTTADKINAISTLNNAHQIYQLGKTIISGAAYTASVYLKAGEYNWGIVNIYDTVDLDRRVYFNLSTGVVGAIPAGCTASIQAVGNGWYRCVVTKTAASTSGGMSVEFSNADNASTFAATIGSGLYLWGAQLVQGSVPGDYQVTTSAAAAVQYSDPNGTRTADKLVENTAAGVAHRVQQTINITSAAITLTAYLQAGERTWGHLRLDDASTTKFAYFDLATGQLGSVTSGATSSISSVGSGWYRCSITLTAPAATASGVAVIGPTTGNNVNTYTGDGTSGIYIWGAQLSNSASVDPYVYNPQAAPTSTAYYGPRFDYNAVTLAANGLLIEEQRVNYQTYSQAIGAAPWGAYGTATAGGTITAPDGTSTGQLITVPTAGNGWSGPAATSISAATAYTNSFYVKASVGTQIRLFMRYYNSGTPTGNSTTTFTITSGQDVGNGWYRIAFTETTPASTNQSQITFLAVNNNDAWYVWGAQLEAGSFATSLIPTQASQVTRAADNASMLGDNFATWYNQTEGTLAAEAQFIGIAPYSTFIADATDASTNNFVVIGHGGSGSAPYFRVTVSNVDQAVITVAPAIGTTLNKYAGAYKANDFSFARNGSLGTPDTSGSVPTVTQLIFANRFGNDRPASLLLRKFSYYPTRLADATLQSITA